MLKTNRIDYDIDAVIELALPNLGTKHIFRDCTLNLKTDAGTPPVFAKDNPKPIIEFYEVLKFNSPVT